MTTLLCFARARELAGARRVELDGDTVGEVLDRAVERFGAEFAELLETCTVMVDGEVVPRAGRAQHSSGAELAVLPPVSGGDGPSERPELSVGVLTVSDRASSGDYDDETGPAVEAVLDRSDLPAVVRRRLVVPDERELIESTLVQWCDVDGLALVLTNGGTGLSPRDVTPEATAAVLDVLAPGIVELMRAEGVRSTPLAALSRQCAGRRGATVVVNLPGSVRGATESLDAVLDLLGHAVHAAHGGGH